MAPCKGALHLLWLDSHVHRQGKGCRESFHLLSLTLFPALFCLPLLSIPNLCLSSGLKVTVAQAL
jgi:hypothetical protein